MQIVKIVGWVFTVFALIGGILFLSYIWRWGNHIPDEVMGSTIDGGASNAPIMLGLFAIAGAYLISLPDKGKE